MILIGNQTSSALPSSDNGSNYPKTIKQDYHRYTDTQMQIQIQINRFRYNYTDITMKQVYHIYTNVASRYRFRYTNINISQQNKIITKTQIHSVHRYIDADGDTDTQISKYFIRLSTVILVHRIQDFLETLKMKLKMNQSFL